MVTRADAPFSPAPIRFVPPPPAELIDGGPLRVIHDALRARLKQAFPQSKFSHRTMRARLTPAEWERMTESAPLVALGWNKMTPPQGGAVRGRVWSGTGHWSLFLVAKNTSIEPGPVLGDALGCGLMGMVAVATAALHGHDLGPGSVTVGEAGEAYSEGWARADLGLAVVALTVPFDLVDGAGLAALDEFLQLGMRWPGLPDLVAPMRDNSMEEAA